MMFAVIVDGISDYLHQKLSQKVNFILPSDGDTLGDADGTLGGRRHITRRRQSSVVTLLKPIPAKSCPKKVNFILPCGEVIK
jgi:hypothetical protein